jgi:hypothetical protein
MENTVSQNLYDILVTRDLEPEILDSSGKAVSDPNDAELMSFDWKTANQNYGTVVILLNNDDEIEVYYGDNLGRAMESDDRGAWYDFLAQIKNFAARNMLGFNLNNINRLKYTMQGMAAIKEGLFEGFYGRKRTSYSDGPKQTKLMIRHSRDLGEGEARYRAIESLFVETANGERFRVPSRSLTHGRMLERHIAEGGTPYDAFGTYINNIVQEMATLSRFVRAAKSRQFQGESADLVAEAIRHYHDLKAKARRMISQRGYQEERQMFDPAEQTGSEQLIDSIRDMFVEQTLDSRIESALPILARLKSSPPMREIQEFDQWSKNVAKGTNGLPQTPEQIETLRLLLSEPLPVGADATNATEQLYDVFGDEELFDRLGELASVDVNADARPLVIERLAELGIDLEIGQDREAGVEENLDTDGVMMTRPSNMSSESLDRELKLLRRFIT